MPNILTHLQKNIANFPFMHVFATNYFCTSSRDLISSMPQVHLCCLSVFISSPFFSLLSVSPRREVAESWGNTTASWPRRSWTTWPKTPSSTRRNSSSGTKVSWKIVLLVFLTWRSSSSSMWRWESRESRCDATRSCGGEKWIRSSSLLFI